ncbi:uncharacterized protein LOC127661255 [Xyrauchen texanus]|uniref:uncharacterized protein LOC127661255 n=1 Tax=Xyrauchen texanus TaxID=154827 RepID=UPI002241C243|nr:uncharacterized protein LOC127661255 [Xyrauchen texanus]
MPRKGKRSQAQKIRWRKLDLEDEQTTPSRINKIGQACIIQDSAPFCDRQQAEDGHEAPRVLSVQASHCQNDARNQPIELRIAEKIKWATTIQMTSWIPAYVLISFLKFYF